MIFNGNVDNLCIISLELFKTRFYLNQKDDICQGARSKMLISGSF